VRKSELEGFMMTQLRGARLDNGLKRQYRFHPPRKWMFDFAWPKHKIALEVEGGTWTGGRHTSGKGFMNDCEKYNHATIMGWKVLRVVTNWIVDSKGNFKGEALSYVEWLFQREGINKP